MKKTIPIIAFLFILLVAACSSPTEAPAPTLDQGQVDESVNATLTAMAPLPEQPTEAPTAEPQPTDTPVPTPTPTMVPVEGDPATLLGEPDGVDTFDSKGNWTMFDNDCFKSEIVDGRFWMESKGMAGIICWEVSWPLIENFYIETEVYMPETCQPNDRFGMLFRAPDNFRGYQYGLTCDGQYYMSSWDGEKTSVIIEPARSEAIIAGPGQMNRIGVVAFGSEYLLYGNGTLLAGAQDTTFTEEGKIGYFVRATTEDGFLTSYDNLKVWSLDDKYYPPAATPPPGTGEMPTPEPGAATVTATTYVNVRTGPGLQYPVLFVAKPGGTGEAIGITSDGAWYAVKLPTNLSSTGTGWVSADYVVAQNTENLPVLPVPPLPPEVPAPPPEPEEPTVTTTDVLSVRNGPSNQCESYGKASTGTTAEAIGVSADGGWYAVNVPTDFAPDGVGWLNANYLTTSNTENLSVIESQYCP
jgi:uncharacterized protein YgiM (DUF1202 family)